MHDQNFDFEISDNKKNERRVYESVDDISQSYAISQKPKKKLVQQRVNCIFDEALYRVGFVYEKV